MKKRNLTTLFSFISNPMRGSIVALTLMLALIMAGLVPNRSVLADHDEQSGAEVVKIDAEAIVGAPTTPNEAAKARFTEAFGRPSHEL